MQVNQQWDVVVVLTMFIYFSLISETYTVYLQTIQVANGGGPRISHSGKEKKVMETDKRITSAESLKSANIE